MNLGAIERKYDPRDYKLETYHEALGAIGELIPAPAINIKDIPYNWQSKWPACGAHALAHLIQVLEYREGRKTRVAPRFGWIKIKGRDGYPLEVGTDTKSILVTASTDACCEYNMLPNDYTLSLKEYSNPSVITKNMEEDAQPRIIGSFAYLVKKDFVSVKNAIDINGVVLILLKCDSGYWGTNYPTFTTPRDGHFVIGVKTTEDEKDKITILCSADKGHSVKKIDKKYFTPTFIREVGTVVDLSNDYVKELVTKIGLLQKLLTLTMKFLKLI